MATLQMKIDSVHAEFLSGNAVSSTVSTHSVVSRDGNGGIWATKLTSANLGLTHDVPTTDRTGDTVFYSSDGDTIYKNTAAGMRSSLSFENSAMITATSTNTASKIVVRDASGNFSAGEIDANGSALSDLNASNLASGTVNSARLSLTASDIPNLNASKINAGTLGTDRIPNLNASKINAGSLGTDRIPTLGAAKIDSGTFDSARIPNLAASKITSGTLGTDRIPSLSAGKITSGTFDAARIPTLNQNTTGSAGQLDGYDSSQFLRKDTGQTVSAGVRYTWSATNTSGLKFVNASYSGYSLEVGGWTSSNNNNISRIRNSSGNLHIDSAANGSLYMNHYSGGSVYLNSSTTCNSKLTVTGYSYDSVSAITDRYFIAKKDLHNNWSLGEDDFPAYNTSIRASYYISGDGLLATSDERAKMEIQTLDTEMALSKLDKIRPVSYKMKHTGQFTFGFIGQEIEKELPNVVNKDMGYISDLNIMGVFSNKQSTKYQVEDEEKDAFVYTLTLDVPIPSTFDVNLSTYIETACVSEGSTAEFFYDPEYCGKPEIGGTVMKLLSEKDDVKEGVSYKIIGTLVNDFRSLDYNEIFTVTTAALKEVNEQLKAEKIKTATLETKYEELLKRVEAIEAL